MTISLRNLPDDIEKAILETSLTAGISLNRATHRILASAIRKPGRNTDFDEFSGSWTAAEAEQFDIALADARQIDPADWAPAE